MPLTLTGEQLETTAGVSLRTQDQNGKYVVVLATHEAVQDHGLQRVEQVASSKYDTGKIEANGTVTVRTSDFF
jgi:hypothetical protein